LGTKRKKININNEFKYSMIFLIISVFVLIILFFSVEHLTGIRYCAKYCDESYAGKSNDNIIYKCEVRDAIYKQDKVCDEDNFCYEDSIWSCQNR